MQADSDTSELQSLMRAQRSLGKWTAEGFLALAAELHKHDYLWPVGIERTGLAAGQVISQDESLDRVTDSDVIYFGGNQGGLVAPLLSDVETFRAVYSEESQRVAFVKFQAYKAWSVVAFAPKCEAMLVASGNCELYIPLELVKELRKHYVDTMNDTEARLDFMMDPNT